MSGDRPETVATPISLKLANWSIAPRCLYKAPAYIVTAKVTSVPGEVVRLSVYPDSCLRLKIKLEALEAH